MSKYIDADRLKAEIESRMGNYDANSKNPNQLLWAELAALIPFIDSLQREQSCETCTNDKGCVTCKDGELWEGKEVDLEKEDNDCPCCGNALDGAGCCSCCGYGRR